jgi:hypothetical protein
MTIHRTRYREPEHRGWINEWAETRIAAELCRAEIEKRYAPKKVGAEIERFELNPGKSDRAAARPRAQPATRGWPLPDTSKGAPAGNPGQSSQKFLNRSGESSV